MIGSHEPAQEGERSLRKVAFLTVAGGAVHSLLFLLSYWLLSTVPGVNASNQELVEFYGSTYSRRLTLVGMYLMPFSGIAFLWFIVGLRIWVTGQVRRENVLLSNVQLIAGILYIVFFLFAAAAASAMATSVEFAGGSIDPVVARQFPNFGNVLLSVFAVRMAAMFVVTTTNIGKTAGILPRWFVLAGYVVGTFLLLSTTLSQALALVFPIWILVLCGGLLVQARRIPADKANGEHK